VSEQPEAEPPNEGERMHAAIAEFVSAVYDHEDATIVTRFVVIAEADDGSTRWVEVGSFGADGHLLPQWEALGLIEYAKRVERGDFVMPRDDEGAE